MDKSSRIITFITLILLLAVLFLKTTTIFSENGIKIIVFSCLFMMCFTLLLMEHFFTKPADVLANSLSILLMIGPMKMELNKLGIIYLIFIFYFIFLSLISITAILLLNKNNSDTSIANKISNILKGISIKLGSGKYMYFLVAIVTMLFYIEVKSFDFLLLFMFSIFVLMLEPKQIAIKISKAKTETNMNSIGEIFGIQSKKIFLVKLFDDRKSIKKFEIVKFRYSMIENERKILSGIIFDTYLLNKEKWAKVLQLSEPKLEEKALSYEKNIVYKVDDIAEALEMESKLKVNNFIGVIIEGAEINKIKFAYSKKSDNLQEGDLIELRVGSKRLFYQVISGFTVKEKLEDRNETGFIEGQAIQLGQWNDEKLCFDKFGWVPAINTPIFVADTTDIRLPVIRKPSYILGNIPGTNLPSIIDLNTIINSHLAIIGITGSGKSFIADKLISELLPEIKIICIDFTAEWKKKFESTKISLITESNVNTYLQDNLGKIGIFELPAMSSTTDVIKATQNIVDKIFNTAKAAFDVGITKKIIIVLEEAHTITPETSFLGEMGDYGSNKALVNRMTQVALQGRKYGVGLIVLAQRTANVSKTVLTQCNTVICFQAFDETSFNFLGNYVGKDMAQTLPNLKPYHAIVAGKAVKSNIPMIVDLTKK